MKSHLIPALLLLSALSAPLTLDAVPAKPGVISVTLPDGTQLPVRLVGDENHHYYLTDDGYPLVETAGGLCYGRLSDDGKIVSTGVSASASAQRTAAERELLKSVDLKAVERVLDSEALKAPRRNITSGSTRAKSPAKAPAEGFAKGPGLFPGTAFPSIGEQKALVILVEYADVKFELGNPHDYFSRMLNEPGFSDYGGTGSAVDYFKECSSGLFRPEFDVYGPVTLSKNMVFYGGNASGNDANPAMMVVEACEQLDAEVDFSQYDRDNDGYIDNVFLFYAGRGEATGGGPDTVWPHSWAITNAYPTKRYEYDGVILDHYACSNEWEGNKPDGVGTFIHEFSHVMGLPDLYTTAYTNAFTPGSWSAMDYGPYNNEGRTPPLYGAYERYALGWMAPSEISEAMNASLPPVGTNVAGIIRTDSDYEFFLLENRQQTSWDTYIPGHGMLVWHIDYNLGIWRENSVNNNANHQYVDIEEADNLKNTATRDGDPFPGYDNVTSFTDNTTPSMRSWSGASLNLPLTEIAESEEGIITFKVKGGGSPIASTQALEAKDVTDLGFTACWAASSGDTKEYVLNVFTRDPEGAAIYMPGYFMRPVGNVTELEIDNLDADTEYFYTVQTARGLEVSEPSNEISVFTSAATIRRQKVEALEAEEITHEGFTARWEPVEGAVDYRITVFCKAWDGQKYDTCDFSDGVNPLPRGWNSSSTSSFANGAYSGLAAPSLRLASDDRLSIGFGDDVRSLKFWHRGSSTSESDRILVYGVDGNKRTDIASVPVVSAKGGVVTVIDDIPAGLELIRLEYKRGGTKGSLAIDDVTVGHGYTYQPHYVEGYEELPVGNVTSFKVTGLASGTDYFYTVRATDGELFSRPSAEVRVATGIDSSVFAPTSTAVDVRLDGRTLSVTAPDGLAVTVHDMLGRKVASGSGSFSVVFPSAGCYAVSSREGAYKLIVK